MPQIVRVRLRPPLARSDHEEAIFEHFRCYPWVFPVRLDDDLDGLLGSPEERVIGPPEAKVREQAPS